MCLIFPELNKCCGCYSLRTACIFIGILSTMTGSAGLSGLHQYAKWDFERVNLTDVTGVFKRAPHRWLPEFVKRSDVIVPLGISVMSMVFMMMGIVLFYSSLFDREDVVELVVWGLFFNVVLGLACVIGVSLQCFIGSKCLYGNMDWLSQAMILVMTAGYLIMWIYFIAVVNSYVVTKYD